MIKSSLYTLLIIVMIVWGIKSCYEMDSDNDNQKQKREHELVIEKQKTNQLKLQYKIDSLNILRIDYPPDSMFDSYGIENQEVIEEREYRYDHEN